ncbi:MAG: indole-3-glycerol phosphate synthase TrpC [Solirubrobacteraceae bacterium]
MSRLDPILAATREEVARRRVAIPPDVLEGAVCRRIEAGDRRSFLGALRRPGLSLIAEHKRRSPSAGLIREGVEVADVVVAYERAGAAALSILTEPSSFGGSLEDLGAARAAAQLPILRTDFIVDSYQVVESFAAGADALLLIVAALSERELAELHAQALDLGVPALVEIHDRHELDMAVAAGAQVIGVNNRDLTTLQVDPKRTFELLPELPQDVVVVAESGFSTPAELDALAEAGVDAVLIGEALMRAEDIEAACRALTARGRLRTM